MWKVRLDHLLSREINLLERKHFNSNRGQEPVRWMSPAMKSPQHPVPGVAPAYLESRIAIGERWKINFFQTRFFSAIYQTE